MKQRLLLSLLMLMVSVGLVKAQAAQYIELSVPTGSSGKVTVTIKNTEAVLKTGDSPYYPLVYFPVGTSVVPKISSDSKTATYEVAYTAESTGTIQIAGAVNQMKNIELTIDGKVTGFDCTTTDALFGDVKSLTFTNNGELESLKFKGLTNIVSVDASNNKLTATNIYPQETTMSKLESFNVSNNPLGSVPKVVMNAKSTIKTLNLSGTELSGDALNFDSFAALEDLDLSNNALTKLTVAGTLKKLNVSKNHITQIKGIGDKTAVTVGKQEISSNVSKKANEGLNMATTWGLNFGLPSFTESDWTKIKDTDIVWEQLANGSTYKKVDHGQRAYGDSNPATFLFYSPSENNVFQSGTYRATIKYNGAEIVISNIQITEAEFNLDIKNDYIKVMKGQNTISDNGTVKQGDILIASIEREGHELDQFKTVGLVEEPKSSIDENHIAFRVAGYRDTKNNANVGPSIDATLGDALLSVITETSVAGNEMNSVSIVAQKADKTIHIKNNDKTEGIPYQSKVVITIKADIGYAPELIIDGDPKIPTLKEGSTTEYEYVIEELVKDNMRIVANVVKNTDVRITLAVEGAINGIGSSTFAPQSQVWINDSKEHVYTDTDVSDPGFVPGSRATLKFYLTKCAVEGTDEHDGEPIVIDQILYGTTPIPFDVKDVTEPTGSQEKWNAARLYTASFEVLPTGGTITIVTKVAPEVKILPNATEGISKNVQVYTYDGNPKAFAYTTNPAKYANDVKVQYKVGSNDYTDKEPVDAGTWSVRYWMESTPEHQAKDANYDWSIQINPAVPEITSIPKVDVQNGKYVITGGAVKFNGQTITNGYFRVVSQDASGKWQEVKNQETTKTAAHLVNVRYTVTVSESGAADGNFESPVVATTATINGKGELTPLAVSYEGMTDENFSIEMFNGDYPLDNNESVPAGATVKVRLTVPLNYNMNNVKLYAGSTEITDKESLQSEGERVLIFTTKITKPTVFKVEATPSFELNKEFTVTVRQYETIYNGEEQAYPVDKDYLIVLWDNASSSQVENVANLKPEFSYAKVVDGVERPVRMPEDAGTYKVYVTIPYQGQQSDWNSYKESNGVGTMVIKEAGTIIVNAPIPTLIPQNQTLSQSNLVDGLVKNSINGEPGDKTVAGTFKWADDVVNTVPEDGKTYNVVFVPDNDSYAQSSVQVKITVSDKNLITIQDPGAQVGTIVVTDANTGKRYYGEEEITVGTQLRIVATPASNFNFNYISVNGTQYNTSEVIYTVDEDESVAIFANFSIIEPEIPEPEPTDPVIDEDSQYIVKVQKATTNNRGFILGKEGENGVYYTKPFEFTVNALDADLDKLVVTGATKVSKGKYRINSVTSNTTVTVSLPNPTPIDVKIVTESKNTKGYLVGKVKAEQYPLDGKCYYGDELVVVAYPVDGVSFAHWRDNTSNRDQMREITVTKAMTIEAVFSGVPTGIEDIESAGIYAGRGYIQVKNVSNADLTVVSISGRIQTRQHLEGDVQVRVPAGVYVVVLENGQDVKRVKVIVR